MSAAAVRSPIFETLDAMIAAGWGEVPQIDIPENWRDIPREVREHDLARVRSEELTPENHRIAAIEHNNNQAAYALAERVMANEAERRKRGRPKVQVSMAWLDLVAERRARRVRRKPAKVVASGRRKRA